MTSNKPSKRLDTWRTLEGAVVILFTDEDKKMTKRIVLTDDEAVMLSGLFAPQAGA